ncbi:hypothetical protein ACIOHH_33510 [Streptomyces microflavus]|uniref:hypothetical protein n=1 Tax=Streptomyces microflavus TaxID=1919 RepID=UPI00382E5E25
MTTRIPCSAKRVFYATESTTRTKPDGEVTTGPKQPECGLCGMTDINRVWAAAAGWRLVLGWLACSHCAGRFPAWMRRQF